MNRERIEQLHEHYVMPTYTPSLTLARGNNATVWDVQGNAYLDFIAGVAVNNVGHCHPRLVTAIREQAGRLLHVSNLFYNELQPRLAQAISDRSLGGKCFFCNSGAEANEALIKLARLWGRERERYRIVTLRNSFHGRTLATLTATGQDNIQTGFAPLPGGFDYAEIDDLDSVRAVVVEQTAAILVEAIQGEGGVIPMKPEFMKGLRSLCDEQDILLMCDEIQCGFGRTGEWFGWQAIGVKPDAMSMAKGMGGGFPIGGITATPAVSNVFQPGNHATTFGGTPLACAAALAVIDIIESEGLLERARIMGERLRAGLSEIVARHDWILDVRGLGLITGLVTSRPALDLMHKAREKGLLVLATANTVIRLVPPLTISEAQVDQAVSIMSDVCRECDMGQGGTSS